MIRDALISKGSFFCAIILQTMLPSEYVGGDFAKTVTVTGFLGLGLRYAHSEIKRMRTAHEKAMIKVEEKHAEDIAKLEGRRDEELKRMKELFEPYLVKPVHLPEDPAP